MRKLSDREGAQACRVVEQAAEDDDVGDDGGDDLGEVAAADDIEDDR